MTAAADVQAAFAAVVVDEWVRAGVSDAVVSPGSRSTPLLVALADDGRLRIHVVLDERSAGFMALGIGMATGRPAPVVTTSGTAAVELHPAVVEAHQAGVPMLAVTADRPPELHHVGAPQTVVQEGLYGTAPRWQVSPGVSHSASASSWRPLASRSVAEAVNGPRGPGPVHLNLAFGEPLLGTAVDVPPGRPDGAPWHRVHRSVGGVPPDSVAQRILGAGRRGLIVAGGGAGDPEAVAALAVALRWPVLADPRSGCRVPGPATVVGAADALLRIPEVAGRSAWHPDFVLRLGRPWASKVLSEWLTGLPGRIPQLLVDPYGDWSDPGRQVGEVVVGDPGAWCWALADAAGRRAPEDTESAWLRQWQEAELAAQSAIDACLSAPGTPLSEPAIARTVVASLPAGATLVASSSMPVRDVEWYGAPRRGVRVVANRGANGIDGVVSTALGVAVGSQAPTVGLIGDLAFIYDAGGLLWANDRDIDCTLVVVDNNGGGIFSFLPQATAMAPTRFETFWATPHRGDPGSLAAAYGVRVVQVTGVEQLAAVVSGDAGRAAGPATARGGVTVAVVATDRSANVAWHDRIHQAVAAAVRRGIWSADPGDDS